MIWPTESAPSPKSWVFTVVPSTATLEALETSWALKNEPVRVGHARMSGKSTSVP